MSCYRCLSLFLYERYDKKTLTQKKYVGTIKKPRNKSGQSLLVKREKDVHKRPFLYVGTNTMTGIPKKRKAEKKGPYTWIKSIIFRTPY